MTHEVVCVRHGATEWSRTGRHTGRTDVPLDDGGRRKAEAIGAALAGRSFTLVLTSPSQRARETCALAGFESTVRDDLAEWDYGSYEGRTTAEIRAERPRWTVWDGCPEGETAADVGVRVDRVIAELRSAGGDALVFGHGHCLRVLAARWVDLDPAGGRCFALDTATLSILGFERESPVVVRWNGPVDGAAGSR